MPSLSAVFILSSKNCLENYFMWVFEYKFDVRDETSLNLNSFFELNIVLSFCVQKKTLFLNWILTNLINFQDKIKYINKYTLIKRTNFWEETKKKLDETLSLQIKIKYKDKIKNNKVPRFWLTCANRKMECAYIHV